MAFQARTSSAGLIGNDAAWIRPPTARMGPPVMLASLNFAITDGRGGMCPMCTHSGPCFLCSDELRWKWEYISVWQARRAMAVRPVPLSDALRTRDGPGPVQLKPQPTHTASSYKAGGEFYAIDNVGVFAEPLFVKGWVLCPWMIGTDALYP